MNTLRNRVQLVGHLGIDPEVKTIPSGVKVATLRIATRDAYFSKGEWKEDTQWHNIVLWDKLAENAEKQLKKGAYVMLEGRLEHRNYVDTKGETRYFTEVKVSSYMLLDKKQSSKTAENDPEEELVMTEAEDLPF